jgi:hypothetical protein
MRSNQALPWSENLSMKIVIVIALKRFCGGTVQTFLKRAVKVVYDLGTDRHG